LDLERVNLTEARWINTVGEYMVAADNMLHDQQTQDHQMPLVKLDQQTRNVKISEFEVSHELIFKFFDRLPESQRDSALTRALQIGATALLEDRIATFLARTENELGTHLEALKLIYEQNVTAKEKSTQIGLEAENRIYSSILDLLSRRGYDNDDVTLTGATTGSIKRNKTGDIVLKIDGDDAKRIAIEIKFDASISVGDFGGSDSTARTRDTAVSQLLEAGANRNAVQSIIVFDKNRSSEALNNQVNGIQWIPSVGFIAVVDYDRGDFSHLHVTIELARAMAVSPVKLVDSSILKALLQRLVADIATIKESHKLLQANHENLKKISALVQKHALLVEFAQETIQRFIVKGEISQLELLELYRGDGIRTRFKIIGEEVEELFPSIREG